MTPEQIKRCAAEIVDQLIVCGGYIDDEKEKHKLRESMIQEAAGYISTSIAEAKKLEDDIGWMRACIAEFRADSRKFVHDVTTDRLIRILERLEGVKK